jgi:SAM-dependent methyltransferase
MPAAPAPAPAAAVPVPPLPLTGERTVPGVEVENYWFQRHVAAYRWAAARCRGRRVVDAGAGEGYGVALLNAVAAEAVGVELAGWVVDHARAAHPGSRFVQADVCDTGLPDGWADVVVSLQVIEHLPDVGRFLAEQRRVLAPGGDLVVTTPNRLTFSPHDHDGPGGGTAPVNVFHVEELTAAELVERLEGAGFEVRQVLGLHHGPRLAAVERATGRTLTDLVQQDAAGWPAWLASVVRRVTPRDFTWRTEAVDDSLDLLALARPQRRPA